MARKRKPTPVLRVDKEISQVKIEQPPLCYKGRESYCRPDLCGKWYDTCEEVADDQLRGSN